MGQYYRYDDEELTEAGGEIYDAICRCKERGIPTKKIIEAMIGELHGLSHDLNNPER